MKKVMKAVAAIMLMTAVVCAAGCKKQEPSSGSFNGHEYVDLGLPSGNMWATSNVEASNAKGYAYFAWGETETKSTYNWSTYKWAADGSGYVMTKYCSYAHPGYENYIDNLTVLQAEDDAATVHWGEGWHTPTKEEWLELIHNTTRKWTRRNGVEGMLFTASNGKTIFLPAAGSYWNDAPALDNEDGLYWSSTCNSDNAAARIQIYNIEGMNGDDDFDPEGIGIEYGVYMMYEYRFAGCLIRPVHSAN